MSTEMLVRSVWLERDVNLLEILPDTNPMSWVRRSKGIVAWGEIARKEFIGTERFSRAHKWWKDFVATLKVEDLVQTQGSGAIAFASFAFDAFNEPSMVVVPKYLVGRNEIGSWLTVFGEADLNQVTADIFSKTYSISSPGKLDFANGALSDDKWQAAVANAISRIENGEIDKIVLAKDEVVTSENLIDPRFLMKNLAKNFDECWTFSVAGLVGATPELLIRKENEQVLSRVLAGTIAISDDSKQMAEQLLASEKDISEHEFAVKSVADALALHCTNMTVPSDPVVLTLANLAHLATDIRGVLVDNAPALALAGALHPTAAVCGTPKSRARVLISELEQMDRGRYAGPVGWFDSEGNGEFGIALRCAHISENSARLFAGAGIVAGSNPQSELHEIETKLTAIKSSLN
ncbi:MAG: isochorismate synthase [Candidatus Nanopelagicales bacterium]